MFESIWIWFVWCKRVQYLIWTHYRLNHLKCMLAAYWIWTLKLTIDESAAYTNKLYYGISFTLLYFLGRIIQYSKFELPPAISASFCCWAYIPHLTSLPFQRLSWEYTVCFFFLLILIVHVILLNTMWCDSNYIL